MANVPSLKLTSRKEKWASFTLIELLTVMGIIAILAALVLSAGSAVMNKGRRSRASAEIQAMSTALEGYKTDNGIYPPMPSTLTTSFATNTYAGYDGSQAAGYYQQCSQVVYMALSGKTNFLDAPGLGVKSYMAFKANQLGNTATAAGTGPNAASSTYVKDPWNNSYGYATGTVPGGPTTNYPFTGGGFFDLWSTGGVLQPQEQVTPTLTNAWIANWQ